MPGLACGAVNSANTASAKASADVGVQTMSEPISILSLVRASANRFSMKLPPRSRLPVWLYKPQVRTMNECSGAAANSRKLAGTLGHAIGLQRARLIVLAPRLGFPSVKNVVGADGEKFRAGSAGGNCHRLHCNGVDQHRLGKIVLARFENVEGAEVHHPISAAPL